MNKQIDRILSFKLSGKFAHFRKFYTNASSLSYLIPPRTVIIGLLASILKLPRDSYYNDFNEDNCKISVSISENTVIKKKMQSMNYLHPKYYDLLTKGKGEVTHSQCKLELLISSIEKNIEYIIYFGFCEGNKLFSDLEKKIKNNDFGYGVYLGQRQFRASIDYITTYYKNKNEVCFLENSKYLDSVCLQENTDIDLDNEVDIVVEQMPIHMKKEESNKKSQSLKKERLDVFNSQAKKLQTGREPVSIKRVLFERNGKRIYGNFRNCYKIGDKVISFY